MPPPSAPPPPAAPLPGGGALPPEGELLAELLVRLAVATAPQVAEARARAAATGEGLGAALVTLGFATAEGVAGAVRRALGLEGRVRPLIGELLVSRGHLTREGLERALERHRQTGRRLGEVAVELGYTTYGQLYEALELQARGGGVPQQPPGGGAPSPSASSASPAEPGPAQARPRRVVVVDDSAIVLAMLEASLQDAGFEVHAYGDPHQALMATLEKVPDILLSDMEMPGMTGLELCRRLKEGPLKRPVPVIILTANDEDALRVSGLRAGAEDYVSKAASLDELVARIDGVLRRADEAAQVKTLFARYTSEAVVEEALRRPSGISLTGERREVTVLFADLRRFTPLAESLAPEQTVSVLNAVLARLADAVLTCGGTLDKFLGDGLMAVWGAPVQRPDDPLRALQAAKMMLDSVDELRQRGGEAGGEQRHLFGNLELGVGLNTGLVVAGNVGSAQRTEYTCIGDAVNVAARLCALAAPGDVLLGERTHALTSAHGRFEGLAPVMLKGKSQPVPIWRLLRDPPGR
jgi:adenylate cyclase